MSFLALFAAVMGSFTIVATVLSVSRLQTWWARACDFPRAQVAALGVVAAVLWATASAPSAGGAPGGPLFGGAIAAATAWQLFRMARYSPVWPVQFRRARRLIERDQISLLFTNVLMDNRDYQRLLDFIERTDPDVILAVECDDRWDAALRPLAARYPHAVRYPQDNTYGMVLYSRLELVDPELRFIRREEVPSIHAGVRLRNGVVVRFHGLHPEPPAPRYASDTKQRDAELVTTARETESETRPTIVGGDLNDVAWSDTTRLFQSISGLLDPRVGRRPMSTFPARWPGMRWPLDHVFCSRHFQLVRFERGPDIGSDHLPVFICVQYAPSEAARNDIVEQSLEDRQEAEMKLASANEAQTS